MNEFELLWCYLCDLCSWWSLIHQRFLFQLYVHVDIVQFYSVVTSSVDFIEECYICDYIWPVCQNIINLVLPYSIWGFPLSLSPWFIKNMVYIILPIQTVSPPLNLICNPN